MPVRNRRVDDSFTLTQSAEYVIVKPLSANSVLSLTQSVIVSSVLTEITQTLNLTQSVSAGMFYAVSTSNTLTLTQSAVARGTLNVSASNTLALAQSVSTTIPAATAGNVIVLTQSVTVAQPWNVEASNVLSLFQETSVTLVINVDVTSFLQLTQQVDVGATALVQTASSHLHLSQSVRTDITLVEASSVIVLTQGVVVYVGQNASSTLELTQSIDLSYVATLSTSNAIVLTQNADAFIPADCTWPDSPVLTARATTVFTYPYVAPTSTVALRNPEFNNREGLRFQRINKQTRGGKRIIFRDPNWPQEIRIKMKFEYLTIEQRRSLLQFLEDSVGQEIGLLDHESRQWRGVILTPSSHVTEQKFGGPLGAGHETTLEFQGVLA